MTESGRPDEAVVALVSRRLWTTQQSRESRICNGSVLFADIAGFTHLTETAKLRAGTRGIEELTARINAVFDDLVVAAHSTGGDILKFGGDAILVAFDANGDDQDAVARAIRCAGRMQTAIARHRRATLRSLSLHLGIAQGPWWEYVAGITGARREHFVWGETIARAMDAADSVSRNVRIDCPARLLPRDGVSRFDRVGAHQFDLKSSAPGIASISRHVFETPNDTQAIWDFVPEVLRDPDRIAAFDAAHSAEHRRVSTVFAFWKCPQGMKNPVQSAELFNSVFQCAHAASSSETGVWARSDPSGDKQKILVLFGATQSSTDDVNRAVSFANTLRDDFAKLRKKFPSLKLGIGVATATVFTGFVGNKERREFTAMGDGVNLAARLAAKAKNGSILVDATTRDESTRYQFRPAGVLALKNVRKPTAVFRPAGVISVDARKTADHIVEHPTALRRCLMLWEDGAHSVHIAVEPGTDARKFLAQLTSRLRDFGSNHLAVTFDPGDASRPLAGLRRLCAILLPSANDPLAELLEDSERHVPRMLARLGLEAAANEIARLVLRQVAPASPIVLDHVEFLEGLDRKAIETLIEKAPNRWLVIEFQDEPHTSSPSGAEVVTLGALTRDELTRVIGDILEPARPSRSLIDFLYERSHGTVRLARSFLSHLISAGAVTRSGGHRAVWQLRDPDSVNIPDGLRAHFLQHVDRLPHPERMVLRAVTLLNDSAPFQAIARLCNDLDEAKIAACLEKLKEHGLIELHSGDRELRASVCDLTCRQAVYETMSYRLREAWHQEAASFWRAVTRPDPARIGEHLFRARRVESAKWLSQAATRAQRLWSLDRARQFSRWAILAAQGNCKVDYASVIPPLSKHPAHTEVTLFDSLAEIFRLQGLHVEAGRIHRWLARIAKGSKNLRLSCHHRLVAARMDWYSGHYEKSGRQALSVLRQSRRLKDQTLTAESAYLFGETCRRTGRVNASLRALTEAEALLRDSDKRYVYADVLNALGLLHWNCGRLEDAHACFERSLRALARSGDPARRGQVANNLGILHEEQGHLRRAEHYYAKSFTVFDRTGVRRHRAYSLGNLANLHRHGARYERARAAYEEVDTELRAMGEAHAAAYTVGNLGDLARDFGDWDVAHERYDSTLKFAIKAGDEELKAECFGRLAHLHLLAGRYNCMPRLLRKSKEAAKCADSREFALYEQMLRAELEMVQSNKSVAENRFVEAHRAATEVGLVYYQLWAQHGLARLAHKPGRIIMSGMTKARRSGYRWWELRFAELGARDDMPKHVRERCLTQCTTLAREIEAGIGDPRTRSRFLELLLSRKLSLVASNSPVLPQE